MWRMVSDGMFIYYISLLEQLPRVLWCIAIPTVTNKSESKKFSICPISISLEFGIWTRYKLI